MFFLKYLIQARSHWLTIVLLSSLSFSATLVARKITVQYNPPANVDQYGIFSAVLFKRSHENLEVDDTFPDDKTLKKTLWAHAPASWQESGLSENNLSCMFNYTAQATFKNIACTLVPAEDQNKLSFLHLLFPLSRQLEAFVILFLDGKIADIEMKYWSTLKDVFSFFIKELNTPNGEYDNLSEVQKSLADRFKYSLTVDSSEEDIAKRLSELVALGFKGALFNVRQSFKDPQKSEHYLFLIHCMEKLTWIETILKNAGKYGITISEDEKIKILFQELKVLSLVTDSQRHREDFSKSFKENLDVLKQKWPLVFSWYEAMIFQMDPIELKKKVPIPLEWWEFLTEDDLQNKVHYPKPWNQFLRLLMLGPNTLDELRIHMLRPDISRIKRATK